MPFKVKSSAQGGFATQHGLTSIWYHVGCLWVGINPDFNNFSFLGTGPVYRESHVSIPSVPVDKIKGGQSSESSTPVPLYGLLYTTEKLTLRQCSHDRRTLGDWIFLYSFLMRTHHCGQWMKFVMLALCKM